MKIEEKIEKYLVSEGVATQSAYFKSILKKKDWLEKDHITKEETASIISGLNNIGDKDVKFSLDFEAPYTRPTSTMRITIIKSVDKKEDAEKAYGDLAKQAEKVVKDNGFKVIESRYADGKRWAVRFKRA